MAERPKLHHPWLVAVWPGMGHVAINAGVYMLSRLGMEAFAELEVGDLFDVDNVEVRDGLIHPGRRPRNRFFAWRDPAARRDLVVFVGEAQPPMGRQPFCRQVIAFARELGVERVFTFAAMATEMRPERRSRVFAAATDADTLLELRRQGRPQPEILASGQISGLNGVLLGAAAESGLSGACLLGEIPHVFAQLPFPKASLAVLELFSSAVPIEFDLGELAEQARASEENLTELLSRVEEASGQRYGSDEEPEEEPLEPERPRLGPSDERRIDDLFGAATSDRSKAFELKRELDRLGVFSDYEDRFLDLFKRAE